MYLELVGQTDGFQDVDIRARVEGFLDTMQFQEGSFVRAGQVLYQIDRKPLEAALAQAVAEKATAEARLTKSSQRRPARYTPLVAKQAVSQQELDDALGAAGGRVTGRGRERAVEKATASISATRDDVRRSTDWSARRSVKPGNLVGTRRDHAADDDLADRSDLVPRRRHRGRVPPHQSSAFPDRVGKTPRMPGIQLMLADGTAHPNRARCGPIERAVNARPAHSASQLMFPESRRACSARPYGRARVLLETKEGALLVPQRAVQELQNLYSVAVVGGDNKVAFRNVKVGPRVDTLWVVEEGLSRASGSSPKGCSRCATA